MALIEPPRKFAIFVSSTSADMERYRRRARDMISSLGLIPIMMEHFPAQPRPPKEVIRKYLHQADAVVVIAGASYGSNADETRSYVEFEVEQARERRKKVAVLVLDKKMRELAKGVDADQRRKQEEFIARISKGRIAKRFTDESFDRELSAALNELTNDPPPDAGYVKFLELSGKLSKVDFLRLIAGLALVRQCCLQMSERKVPAVEQTDARRSVQQVLEILHDEMSDHPVTVDLVSNLVTRFLERLHDLPSEKGFAPQSKEELRLLLDVLFGEGLRTLKATSIHSNKPELASYKGYWNDPELGTFFREKNQQFLRRSEGGHEIRRIYACDTLADSVAEPWFAQTVLEQVRDGAQVKVVEIREGKESTYEDFGIYEHDDRAGESDGYLLLAPAEQNRRGDDLRTIVTPERKTVEKYKRRFEKMWQEREEILEVDTTPQLDEACNQDVGVHGTGTINDLFENCVILRKMRRLDTNVSLIAEDAGFVRKYEMQYAEAVAKHIRSEWSGTKQILYVGDTYGNDGAAIRNLQHLGLPVRGFICEPQLDLHRLWFNSTLYSSEWTDLVGFVSRIREQLGNHTVAIFDIDQTLWAPKGVHEKPLSRTRTQAMARLIDSYVHDADNEVAQKAKKRILPLYEEISRVPYHKTLTMDNEDYKAAICVFLALNLVWDPQEERTEVERGAEFFTKLGQLSPPDFVAEMRDNYLAKLINSGQDGLANMNKFIQDTMAVVTTNQYSYYGETNKISVQELNDDVFAVFRAMAGPKTIKYEPFRLQEFEEAHRRATADLPLDDSIVISKPTWDLASWLKGKGAKLLALSDRPDEATALGEQSLLNAQMTIYGRPIIQFLENESAA